MEDAGWGLGTEILHFDSGDQQKNLRLGKVRDGLVELNPI